MNSIASGENGSENGNNDNASDNVQAVAEELQELHLHQAQALDNIADDSASADVTPRNTNILPPPHAISLANPRPYLPCTFTVLQGIPGDGMANTIDSAPLMEYHGGSNSNHGSNRGSRAGSRAGSRRGSAALPLASSLAIAEVEEEEDEEEPNIEETRASPNSSMSSHADSDAGGNNAIDDDDDEKLEERASASMIAATDAEPTSNNTQQPEQRPRPRSRSFEAMAALENEAHHTTEGGLHLPIPPSLGISAHLPPLVPAPAPAPTRAGPTRIQARVPSDTPTNTPPKVDNNVPSPSTSPNVNLSRAERRAVKTWETECRERERRQREETLLELRQRQITTASFASTNRNTSTSDDGDGNDGNASPPRSINVGSDEFPYARNGRLAVFANLPTKNEGGSGQVSWGTIQGDLAPGCAVDAVDVVALDPETFQKVECDSNNNDTGGLLLFLAITAPVAGFVLYRKEDGSTLLGCGQPSHWARPDSFIWRVCCPDGALIRDGLELTAAHVQTVPHGSFVKVMGKTVNSMGLGRLRVEAVLHDGSTDAGADHDVEARTVTGWISEALNPLSGQRGPVVQPVPLPAPLQCRIIYAEGATIRSGIELSSAEVGHAPAGAVITVVGRAFSEYPTDNCIERLKLAGGAGWISVRLNKPPPLDEPLVEVMGIDDSFDANDPGPYHLRAQTEVMNQLGGAAASSGGPPNSLVSQAARRLMRIMSTAELSSIHDEDEADDGGDVGDEDIGNSVSCQGGGMTLFRNGMGGGALAMAPPGHEICLICLTDERDATIVHGGTGHIATCLGCARILKARGDNCPVCRLPIDTVIQQFWA